jgi:hypothetical protein
MPGRNAPESTGKVSQGQISDPAQQTKPRILPQVIGHNALAFTSWRKPKCGRVVIRSYLGRKVSASWLVPVRSLTRANP